MVQKQPDQGFTAARIGPAGIPLDYDAVSV
jgi:hypothetical protein